MKRQRREGVPCKTQGCLLRDLLLLIKEVRTGASDYASGMSSGSRTGENEDSSPDTMAFSDSQMHVRHL